ncbi:MAG: AI-2E family transporter [Solirubrobacterales bacterium]
MSGAADVSGKLLIVALAVVVTLLFVWSLRAVVIPIFLALLIATQLSPAVAWLKARRVPPGLAVASVVLASILVFAGVLVGIVGQFIGELDGLGQQISDGTDDAAAWVAKNSGPLDWSRADVDREIDNLGERLEDSRDSIFRGFLGGASAIAGIGVGALLAFAFLIYMLADGGKSFRWFKARFEDEDLGDALGRVGMRAWDTLTDYVRGVTLVATFDAILIGAVLFLLGVPLAGALTAMVFVFAFIPIIGAWVSGVIATLVTLAGNGFEAAIVVAAVSLAVQQLEALVVAPQVYRRMVRLNPMVTLAAVATGTILAGVLGAFIAVPVTATIWASIEEWRAIRKGHAAPPGRDAVPTEPAPSEPEPAA